MVFARCHWEAQGDSRWTLELPPYTLSRSPEPKQTPLPMAGTQHRLVAELWDVPRRRGWSLGHSGSKGASVQERWGGVSSSLMPFSGNEHQTG